jgi:hypothetical protein
MKVSTKQGLHNKLHQITIGYIKTFIFTIFVSKQTKPK